MMLSNAPPMALVKTTVPATKATPRTIAKAERSRRSLRATRLRQVTSSTSAALGRRRPGHCGHAVSELLHLVQDLLAVRVTQLVDDPAVGEEDDAVCVRRGHRVV